MGGFSVGGFSGGLDVQGLVEQILWVESAPIRRLEQQKSEIEKKIEAYNDLNSKLSSLLSKLDSLNNAATFAARKATSSDEKVFTATAESTAAEGSYQIAVNRLARFDNYKSDAVFSTSDAAIGTGSFDLTVGTTTTTITIDSTNNTLSGLKNAINESGAEVNASIINDGTGYRLTITSKDSGAENAITVSNNTLTLADGSSFTFSRTHNITSTSELDASLVVNGLSVTSSSNTIDSVIEGVTLKLTDVSASEVNLTVSNDTEKVKSAIQEFVDAYNEAYSFLNEQFTYNTAAKTSGLLAGDSLLRRIQSDLSTIVRGSIPGLTGSLNNLGTLAVELQNDGTLVIDSEKLDDNLENNFAEIQKLFTAHGKSTHADLLVLGIGSATQTGSYDLNITQLADTARIVAPNAITPILGVDETLTFTMGSQTSVVNLTKTMKIDEIVATINNQFAADGMELTASNDGANRLAITSNEKGADISFTVVSDQDLLGTGIGTAGMSDSGLDVEGTFTDLSTGAVYAARSSSFDVLVGDEGPVQDLQVQFLGTTTGTYSSIGVTLGFAELLQRKLESITDSIDGSITTSTDGLKSSIRNIDADIRSLEERLAVREQYLTEEYSRANQALAQLASLQASLGAQLSQLIQ